MARTMILVCVMVWCSECTRFTWHIHTTTGTLVCLLCKAKGKETICGAGLVDNSLPVI